VPTHKIQAVEKDIDSLIADMVSGNASPKSELISYFVEQIRLLLKEGQDAQSEYDKVLKRKSEIERRAIEIRASLKKYRDDINHHSDDIE